MLKNSSVEPVTLARLLRIHGRVQGVYYRVSMIDVAQRLGVQGWVRNRLDGSVEALAVAPAAAMQGLLDWAAQGPAAARVDQVDSQEAPAALLADLSPGFEQRATL